MTVTSTPEQRDLLRQAVLGSRRPSNYFWATATSLGGLGFLLAGLSSYFQTNLLPFSDATQLIFIPQGIAMSFYGVVGLLVGTYQWLSIVWDIGGGYNEFDRNAGHAKIFRWGFPGKDRKIEITYPLDEIQAIRIELRDGINPRRRVYLKVKGRRDIPLTRVGQPMALAELENQGAELAKFLSVPLEGL
jgi:Ycf4